MKIINIKLKSESGETISEVLVAMLVVSLGSVMFAGMVSASEKLISKSKEVYQTYITEHNEIEEETVNGENGDIAIKSDDNASIKLSGDAKEEVTVYKDEKYFIYK